jgi:very-short-patch-repair endonuclease
MTIKTRITSKGVIQEQIDGENTTVASSLSVEVPHVGLSSTYTHPDGLLRTYVPDFYAFDDRVLYEVKGRHDEVDTAKWDAAVAFCEEKGWKFEVLFEDNFQ